MKVVAAVVPLLILLLVGPAAAQEERPLDPNAVPDHGIAAGAVGFQPDPFRIEGVTGGGDIDAAQRNLGADCAGRINVQPAFRFQALTAFDVLRFVFIADAVTADATLIVLDPHGDFHCNNNFAGLRNPLVEITAASPGVYNVWVGALTNRVFGDLYLTARSDVTPGSTSLNVPRLIPTATPLPTATPIPATALNPTLFPLYGTENLTAGFLPDPYYRVVYAGGALDAAATVSTDAACAGYATSAPSFRLNWAGESTRLRFLFAPLDAAAEAAAAADAALIVQDPAGGWLCNRDFAGGYTRPQVDFVNPLAGTYNVWVSNEVAPGAPIFGVLYVTEKTYSPETVNAAGTPPTEPITGLTPSTSAFVFDAAASDPYAIPGALAGGAVDVGSLNPDCPGTYTALPAFGFVLPQPTPYLRIFFVSDDASADAALIVQMPDGTWYCADDSPHSKQPIVDVIGNLATGSVSIWLGSFNPGESISGTLYLTRGSANPLDPTRPAPVVMSSGG